MTKRNGRKRKRKEGVSRREFIKLSASVSVSTIATTGAFAYSPDETKESAGRAASKVPRNAILFAIGDTLIPSAPGDPGYRDLEWYGITDEISRRIEITDEDLEHFNRSSAKSLGKKFTDLSEKQREDHFNHIIRGTISKDEAARQKLKEIYTHVREMVIIVYYQNFPEHSWPRDARRVPLLKPGDEHQLTNPNTNKIVTGWDQAGYAGPLTWEEEEKRRKFFKQINWQE